MKMNKAEKLIEKLEEVLKSPKLRVAHKRVINKAIEYISKSHDNGCKRCGATSGFNCGHELCPIKTPISEFRNNLKDNVVKKS